MKNYTKIKFGEEGRIKLEEKQSSTGIEVTINYLSAWRSTPCTYSLNSNEEIYDILAGKGKAVVDGDEIELTAGDGLKVLPAAKRQLFAASDSNLTFFCIQLKENLLESFTAEDAIIES